MCPDALVQLLKFGKGLVISSNTLQGMWLLIHAGIKLFMLVKRHYRKRFGRLFPTSANIY